MVDDTDILDVELVLFILIVITAAAVAYTWHRLQRLGSATRAMFELYMAEHPIAYAGFQEAVQQAEAERAHRRRNTRRN